MADENKITPDVLTRWLASDDPQEVMRAQKHLKAGGYYDGPIDAKVGAGTTSAMESFRDDFSKTQERDLERTRIENETPWLDAAKEYSPLALGLGGGYLSGHLLGKGFDKLDEARAGQLSRLAGDESLDPKEADKVARRRGLYASGKLGRAGRLARGMVLPGLFLGGSEYTREEIAPRFEEGTNLRELAELAATGEQYAAMGSGMAGIKDALSRREQSDAVDEARLRSRAKAARRPQSRMAEVLAGEQARDITPSESSTQGRRQLSAPDTDQPREKVYIRDADGRYRDERGRFTSPPKSSRSLTSRAGRAFPPIMAGAMAYDAIRGDAGAEEVEPGTGERAETGGSLAEALAGGTVAGAGAYGTMKGIEKGGEMAARYAPGLARVAGRLFPPAAAALTAYDLYRLAQEYPPEREAGTGAAARREPTPRELTPEQLRQLHTTSPLARALAGQ